MADEDSRRSEMITLLFCHVTSYPHDADVKGDIFGRAIYPPSLVVTAFIFSGYGGGGCNVKFKINLVLVQR